MRRSRRIPANLAPNRLATARAALADRGTPILDLTESNPTRAGLNYPDDLLEPLGHPRGLTYAPEPFGLRAARRAVAGDFARRGLDVSPHDLALTASTSEAYALLFKLLCDPGDEILVPTPSYPLFEHLSSLDAVRAVPYLLEYHGAWTVDLGSIDRALTGRTRAVLIVSPNNPTGQFISPQDLAAIAERCRPRDVAVIVDEVFADYELIDGVAARAGRLVERADVLGFTLGGLSKSIGLPQAKLAWIAISGPAADVRDARAGLELVCDTYLSVSTPVQAAAADLLDSGAGIRRQIQERIRANWQRLEAAIASAPACRLLRTEAGWNAVLQVPSFMAEEDMVIELLEQDHVLAHPGYFFDFSTESFLVVSLLTRDDVFAEGAARIARRFAAGDR